MATVEPVFIDRTGLTSNALIDPQARKLYLDSSADVDRGDTAGFRGMVRRVDQPVEYWLGAGKVATFEEGEPFLPDLGKLLRNVKWTTDYNTGDRILAAGDELWSGPCHVDADPYAFDTRTDVGSQMVSTTVFLIQTPLTLLDAKDGDTFQITSSRDGRLLVRPLTVKAARASSDRLYRELLAFDYQGD